MVDHRLGSLDPIFVGLSWIGNAGLVWIVLSLGVALAMKRSPLWLPALTAACVWGADVLALALKAIFDRPRPFETIAEPEPLLTGTVSASLPSGHAATSAAGAVILSAFAPRWAPVLGLLALAIAFSRVYVGVHYPADILLGLVLGAAVALLGLRFRRPLRLEGSPRPRSRSRPKG